MVAVTEGQLNALVLLQAGVASYATLGTAITDQAVDFLRSKDVVTVCGDPDAAGQKFNEQLIEALAGHVELYQVPPYPEGCNDVADIAARAHAAGKDASEVVAEWFHGATGVKVPAPYGAPVQFKEWLTKPPEAVRTLLEPFLVEKRRHIVWGPAEGSKSMWAQWAASQLTRQGRRVIFVSQENPEDEDQRRFYRLRPDADNMILYHAAGIDLCDPSHAARFVYDAKGADIVFLDALTAVWTGDENDNREIADLDQQVFCPLVTNGTAVVVLDHIGHPQAFMKRKGVNAGRGASAKGQKSDITLEFVPQGTNTFEVVPGKFRAGNNPKPPSTLLQVVDTEDGGLDIETLGATDTLKIAEMAEGMVRVIEAQGALTTKQLREAMKGQGGRDLQTAAIRLLETEDPPRTRAVNEKFDTGGGPQMCKVWRLVESIEQQELS
ncbi:MAG: AAA family ATPase [Actinomycetota bacterium]